MLTRFILLSAIILAALAVPAAAAQMPISSNVSYITGGYDDDERLVLEGARRDYNFHVLNANAQGEFTGADRFIVRDSSGQEILNASDTGPMIYAKLPPGSYTIEAVNGSERRQQKIEIAGGRSTNVNLIWPLSL